MNELEQFKTVHGVSWSSLDTEGISMELKTTAIRAIKQEVRLREWSAQIKAQQASGQTVQQWCAQNAVNPQTYYYHLKRVREQYLESAPSIVPLTVPQTDSAIHIEKNGLQISLPADR